MPQGAASAPDLFQRVMSRVNTGLKQIKMYLDDPIALDGTPAEHVRTYTFSYFACENTISN